MRHWYTDNILEQCCEEGTQPEGWHRGRSQLTVQKQLNTEMSKPKELREMQYKQRATTNIQANHKRSDESREKMRLAKIDFIPWNKGLTKLTDSRVARISDKVKAHMISYTQNKKEEDPTFYYEWRKQLRSKMHANNTCKASKPEDSLYIDLCQLYGKDDVIRHYYDSRYPYECDFYIKSQDKFIELNYHPSHNDHPFDSNNADDVAQLNALINDNSSWSNMIIDVWTRRDVAKLNCAISNKLNYEIIYKTASFTIQ